MDRWKVESCRDSHLRKRRQEQKLTKGTKIDLGFVSFVAFCSIELHAPRFPHSQTPCAFNCFVAAADQPRFAAGLAGLG